MDIKVLSYIGVPLVELNANLWVMTVLIVLLHLGHTRKADLPLWCVMLIFIYLFGVLRHFQHCTGHITTGSWKGRGNQYI